MVKKRDVMVSIGFVSGYGILAISCEHTSGLPGSMRRGFLGQLSFSRTLCQEAINQIRKLLALIIYKVKGTNVRYVMPRSL
jgi:hypothetical protein